VARYKRGEPVTGASICRAFVCGTARAATLLASASEGEGISPALTGGSGKKRKLDEMTPASPPGVESMALASRVAKRPRLMTEPMLMLESDGCVFWGRQRMGRVGDFFQVLCKGEHDMFGLMLRVVPTVDGEVCVECQTGDRRFPFVWMYSESLGGKDVVWLERRPENWGVQADEDEEEQEEEVFQDEVGEDEETLEDVEM
jgi:hypothetical protein